MQNRQQGQTFLWGMLVGLPAGLLAASLLATGWLQYVMWNDMTDDAYFTFRYIDNMLAGNGLVYNVGDRIEAFSNPSWLFILAAFKGLLGGNLEQWASALGVAATAATLLTAARICTLLEPARKLPVLAWSVTFILLSTGVQIYAGLGLETPLLMFALMLGGYFTLRAQLQPQYTLYPAALCFALAGITRPEGLLYGALWLLLLRPFQLTRNIKLGLVVVLPYALYTAFRLYYYGRWLPYTFEAKPPNVFGLDLLSNIYDYAIVLLPVIALLVVREVLGLCRREPTPCPTQRSLALAFGGPILAGLIFQIYAVSDWMIHGRFLVPILPLMVLLACSRCFGTTPRALPHVLLLLAAFGVAASTATDLKHYLQRQAMSSGIMRGESLRIVASWAAAHLPPNSLIVGDTTGTLSYYNMQADVRDLSGLTDRAQLAYALARIQAGGSYYEATTPGPQSPLMQQRPTALQDLTTYIDNSIFNPQQPEVEREYTCILSTYNGGIVGMPEVTLSIDLWVRNDLIQPEWPRCDRSRAPLPEP